MSDALRRILLLLIRAYQLLISPWLPPACRFEPSCSNYGTQALQRHGAWRGLQLILRRLLRCRPGGGRGYDPVPAPLTAGTACRGAREIMEAGEVQ